MLLALLLAAPQQLAPLPSSQPGPHAWYVEAPSRPGTFTRAVAADLDGDRLDDWVVVRGTQLEAVFGAGLYPCWMDNLGQAASDVAPLAGQGPDAADTVAVVGPSGLHEVRFLWTPGDTEPYAWQTTALEGTDWLGAERVTTFEVAGEAQPRIYGLAAGSAEIRLLRDAGAGYVDTCVYVPTVSILDVAAFDREADGVPELACLTATGLRILRQTVDGLTLDATYESSEVAPVAMAVGSQTEAGPEWVAFVAGAASSPATQSLYTYGASGLSAPHPVAGSPEVVGLDAGDADGDGRSDLLLSWRATQEVAIVTNTGTTSPQFDTAAATTEAYGSPTQPAPTNSAQPVFLDVNANGSLDVALPIQATEELFVWHRGPIPGPGVPVASGLDEGSGPVVEVDEDVCTTSDLHFFLELPSQIPNGATHLQVALWQNDRATGETAPWSIDVVEIPIASMPTPPAAQPIALTLLGGAPDADHVYFWLERPIRVESGSVTRVFAHQVHGVQIEADWETTPTLATVSYLETAATGPWSDVVRSDCPGPDPDTPVGGVLPVLCLIDLPPNQPARVDRSAL